MGEVLHPYDYAFIHAPSRFIEQVGADTTVYVVAFDDGDVELVPTERQHEVCIFAYNSVPALRSTCGAGQPYRPMSAREIETLADGLEYVVVIAYDVECPLGERFPEPEPPQVPEQLRPLATDELLLVDELREVGVESLHVVARESGSVEFWESEPEQLVIFGYTRVSLLVSACGLGQPFTRLTVDELKRRVDGMGTVLVALNGEFADGHRFPEPGPDDVDDVTVPEAEFEDEEPWVFLPTTPNESSDGPIVAELLPAQGGRRILCVWTSRAALEAGAGVFQPWRRVPLSWVEEIAKMTDAHEVRFDPNLPKQARHTGLVVDWRDDLMGEAHG